MTIVEITKIIASPSASRQMEVHGRVDNGVEHSLFSYFPCQDEMSNSGSFMQAGFLAGPAQAAGRVLGLCQMCLRHKGHTVHGYMMHGQYTYCDCCMTKEALESAREAVGKIPEWEAKLAVGCEDMLAQNTEEVK